MKLLTQELANGMAKRSDDPPEDRSAERPSVLSDLLGEGLRVAFGAPPTGQGDAPLRQESVVAWLRRTVVDAPRVALRDCDETVTPIVRSAPETSTGVRRIGPYAVVGEIARGGVGVIHKVQEPNLGRDLALKVLQGRHEKNLQLLLRFIEEAQIASQLQHPGVVPIHELGEHNGLPYFTMKLVQGRTFGALLEERESPADRRSYFLGVFERIVDTLAYVHARGVIHRDAKPSNIMVGSFGEVQVMDWGFAKVLGNAEPAAPAFESKAEDGIRTVRSAKSGSGSDSLAGSVLGTPAYMAPEQARGEIEILDERVDVFGLGAILCEILTGNPPYSGTTVAEVHQRACDGDLEPALKRIGESGADPELVRIVSRCLAVDPRDRLRHAGMVARELREYLESLETRARSAELDAAEARVRADEAHKRRRLATATATIIAFAVVLFAGSILYFEHQADKQREDVARGIQESLQKASELRDEAWSGDLAKWEAALTIARQAQLQAEAHGDPLLLEQAQKLTQEIGMLAFEEKRAHAMVDRLANTAFEGDLRTEREQFEKEYEKIFLDFGIDVETVSVDQAVEQVLASGIAEAIVTALDQWAVARLSADPRSAAGLRLLEIAQLSDQDNDRMSIRKMILENDREAVEERVVSEDLPESLSTVFLLASGLDSGRDFELLQSLYLRAHQRHPSDFRINYELGELFQEHRKWEDSVRYFAAAVALRPESVSAGTGWGRALRGIARNEEAARAFGDTIERRPDSAAAYSRFGYHLYLQKRFDEALYYFDRALEIDDTDAATHHRRAKVFRRRKQWPETIAAYERVVAIASDDHWAWFWLGACLERYGDFDRAVTSYRRAIRLRPDFAEAYCNLGYALVEYGRGQEAVEVLEVGHRMGSPRPNWSHESKRWLGTVKTIVGFEQALAEPGLEDSEIAKLAREAAEFCEASYPSRCVGFFELLFETDPTTLRLDDLRYRAARAAVKSGRLPLGAGTPGGIFAVGMRRKALGWLHDELAELDALVKLDDSESEDAFESEAARRSAVEFLQRWKEDEWLAPTQNQEYLGSLPFDERQSFRVFWTEVERVSARLANGLTLEK